MNDSNLCNLLRRFRGSVGDMEVAREAAERIELLASQLASAETDSSGEIPEQICVDAIVGYKH